MRPAVCPLFLVGSGQFPAERSGRLPAPMMKPYRHRRSGPAVAGCEVSRARALCEKLLSYASPLLLYAEEIDPHSGRQLGNFPQAFSHLALINALIHLIREDERRSAVAVSALDPVTGA